MALVAVHLGVVDQREIDDMSYDWFTDVLDVLGEVVNFSAIVNYAGNAFVEKSWDMILDNNPMLKGVAPTAEERQMAAFFDTSNAKVIKSKGEGIGGLSLFEGRIERNGNRTAGAEGEGQGVPPV